MPKAEQGENDAALQTDMGLENLFGLKGRVALITGGGSGIGAMTATALARAGATVFIASRKDTSAFAAELPNCTALQCDVGKADQAAAMLEEVKRRAGALHILINNAGTNYSAPLGKYSPEMFDKVMLVNVRAVFALTQLALPLLAASTSAEFPSRVVNVSSINGIRAPAEMDTFAYSASKAAVLRLGHHLAPKLAKKGVLINTVCPGPFESRMMRGTVSMVSKKGVGASTALKRMGEPQDIGGVMLFLSGRAANYMTGTEVVVDGGALVASRL